MTKLPWKPWHEVVKLRDDLRSGELPMHMFAADLYEVMMQRGKRPIYEKPENFFALTFPTYNLRHLVKDVVLRLAGKNDKAVRQLELTYGGGKTHTLITLRHIVNDPVSLPALPSVDEFIQEIGQRPPRCRVAALCFDKLDVEKGMEVLSADGRSRMLRQPWSVLAWQLAGDEGLRLLHASGASEERDTAPAENLLAELLAMPERDGVGVLVLIDEVLMYARERAAFDPSRRNSLENFFQYLTQAATKTDRCCVVASLLTSEPTDEDELGRKIKGSLYDIFQRQREPVVEPVEKQDVAEVLRRRFFTPESLRDREIFRQHVLAALKGIVEVDEQTARQKSDAEERFLGSFPFHPDLTEVLYSKWTALDRFQRTRGVLRMFALALREAEKWDSAPLIGPSVFLSAHGKDGLSEALREMVAVADTEEWEGKKQAWAGILDSEFSCARQIQTESAALKHREIEQAVVATFLHSQPIGQNARTRDLTVLLGATRPDRIELEKGLSRWARLSYWLDDAFTTTDSEAFPGTWRLGNRPNLTQMHAATRKNISDETVRARLLEDVGRTKALTAGASAAGIRVHSLPNRPKDIEDDGAFHYAVLGPDSASESGKPNPGAARFLDETTGPDRPRVFRNAVLLLVPSQDGLELAMSAVRDYLAWEFVLEEVKRQQKEGNVDPARAQTLQYCIDKAKGHISDAIRQAYSVVVTASEKNDVQAFRITISDEPHFGIIKADRRSRIQETAVTAEALLPDGPYNLWRSGETSRRVKDLAGAFAQFPHLPKMLKAGAITETLANGCEQGIFVLRLTRPDGTSRSWWMSRPDESALEDPAMELLLPESAELGEIPPELLVPRKLPELWLGDEITVGALFDYFGGKTITHIERNGYVEPISIPKASERTVEAAIEDAVLNGTVCVQTGPASFLSEQIPDGVLTREARLCVPPTPIPPAAILQENLPGVWRDGTASVLSIMTAMSIKAKKPLPWKTIRDVVDNALRARFLLLSPGSHDWPCDQATAQFVKLMAPALDFRVGSSDNGGTERPASKPHVVVIDLEPRQLQDLGDRLPELLEIKAKMGIPIRFKMHVELGNETSPPSSDAIQKINKILDGIIYNA